MAGIILMLTGAVYTLIGIKNRWVNCFFSTAYITAVGITVLIVYLMNVPVSRAIQGAYVVAATLSGCALGAASLIFKELTEGLGCALGGFCLSMWFLCLAPGGLLHDTLGRSIFISCFSVVGFSFYFSRYTRDWAMIILMSFGGATAIVLGIDCYSRAGLKEFWAYVWNLNDALFPLGATTYPITRGIRVEIAAIVIICLIGIISQMKLWKVVREKREKKALSLAEDQRHLEEEEENVGRNIEAQTARERVEWEKVYGGRTLNNSNGSVSNYSDGIDGGSNSKRSRGRVSESIYTDSKVDGIEMADMSDSSVTQARAGGLMSAEMAKEGKVMVRVAVDEIVEVPDNGEDDEMAHENMGAVSESEVVILDSDKSVPPIDMAKGKQASQASSDSRRVPRQQSITPTPEVVPLPFKVPTEDDLKSVGDRSSVATFADDEAAVPEPHPRDSLVKRVSQSSITLLRSLSQQKLKNASSERQLESGESSEGLVEPATMGHEDDQSSLAATVDCESISEYDEHGSIVSTENRKSIEITAQLGQVETTEEPKQVEADTPAENGLVKPEYDASREETQQEAETGPKEEETNESASKQSKPQEGYTSNKQDREAKDEDAIENKETPAPDEQESTAAVAKAAQVKLPESTEKTTSISSGTSKVVSLTKDRLPHSLSRVALSYRTNEWAKHLGHADTPEPDAIHIEPYEPEQQAEEVPRYVDMEDLQKTVADDALPSAPQRLAQSNSKINRKKASLSNVIISAAVSPDAASPGGSPGSPPAEVTPLQSALRRTSTGFAPIVEEQHGALAGMPLSEEFVQQESPQLATFRPIVPRVVSFSNPQTLLGQRETVLRSRSQGNLVPHLSEMAINTQGSVGDADSLYNYSVHNGALSPDLDDLPLSQRREMMRQSSMTNLPPSNYRLNRSSSGVEVSGNTQFNSHQPKRISSISVTAREAKLANFRQSIAHDLQSMTPGVSTISREAAFASTPTLIDDIDTQRIALMEKKEAEMQRREMQRREKEWYDRMFDSRMRSGDLLGAHREVIRKMQSSARDA